MEGKVNNAAAGNGKKEIKKAEHAQLVNRFARQTANLFTNLTAHFAEAFCKIHLFVPEHAFYPTVFATASWL